MILDLFRSTKIDIDSISIPTFNWEIGKQDESIKQWINPDQAMSISINFFDSKPDLPTITNLSELRNFYRTSLSKVKGGVLEVELIDLNGFNAIKTLFKIPQKESGMTYLASLTIPFKKKSFVVKIQAPEVGTTGMRNSVILSQVLNEQKLNKEEGEVKWLCDPYNNLLKEGNLMNESEKERYDFDFPQHALSQARAILKNVIQEIQLKEELTKVKPFNK